MRAAMIALGVSCLLGLAPPPGAAEGFRYRYDAATGRCVGPDGAEGLNPVTREMLRGGGDLECADLRAGRVNITYVELEGASLRGADFTANGCYLTEIRRSDLTGARLAGVRCRGGRFPGSDLTGADLRGADLPSPGTLDGAVVTGARFDARTRLPFDRDEALRRGMVETP
jgi:uncharacterized protein YjbI with pentapeptide repeats